MEEIPGQFSSVGVPKVTEQNHKYSMFPVKHVLTGVVKHLGCHGDLDWQEPLTQ